MASLGYLKYHFSDIALITLYTGIIDILIRLSVGIKGNDWRRLAIKEKGFTLKQTVLASSPDKAIWMVLPEQERRELDECPHHYYQIKRERYSLNTSIIIGISAIGFFYGGLGLIQFVQASLLTFVVTWAFVYALLFPVGYRLISNLNHAMTKLTRESRSPA